MTSDLQPNTVVEAREIIADLLQRGESITPKGAGTRIRHEGRALQTGQLRGVRFFEPGDMVIGVEAGLPFAELRGMLRECGMDIPVANWLPGATVGGVVAANDFGPYRLFAGGIRDYIIGIEYVDGSGKLVKAGGRVVKNVTGYDLGKMMTGSRGGLGLITAVNFRTKPLPIEPHTLFFSMRGNHWLDWFRDEVMVKRIPLEWAQAVFQGGHWFLAMGIAGNEARRKRLVAQLQPIFDNQLTLFADEETPAAMTCFDRSHRWDGFLKPFVDEGKPERHLHINAPASAFLRRKKLLQFLTELDLTLVYHPVGADLHIMGDDSLINEEYIDRIRRLLSGTNAYMTLERVSAAEERAFGYCVPLPSEYALMQRLKRGVDPHGVFQSPFYEML